MHWQLLAEQLKALTPVAQVREWTMRMQWEGAQAQGEEEVHEGGGLQGAVEEGADVVQEESRQEDEDGPSKKARGMRGK